MKRIKLQQSDKYALVDDEDYERLSKMKWYFNRGYAQTNIKREGKQTMILMHKLLCGYPVTDHKNMNGLDNQKSNLRLTTQDLNQANKKKLTYRNRVTNSIYKGVTKRPDRDLFRVKVGKFNVGYFRNEIHAAMAYDLNAINYYGEFARTNFPQLVP